jgi:hypothetical protein
MHTEVAHTSGADGGWQSGWQSGGKKNGFVYAGCWASLVIVKADRITARQIKKGAYTNTALVPALKS